MPGSVVSGGCPPSQLLIMMMAPRLPVLAGAGPSSGSTGTSRHIRWVHWHGALPCCRGRRAHPSELDLNLNLDIVDTDSTAPRYSSSAQASGVNRRRAPRSVPPGLDSPSSPQLSPVDLSTCAGLRGAAQAQRPPAVCCLGLAESRPCKQQYRVQVLRKRSGVHWLLIKNGHYAGDHSAVHSKSVSATACGVDCIMNQ